MRLLLYLYRYITVHRVDTTTADYCRYISADPDLWRRHAMHYSKRMRCRKELGRGMNLPLACKHGHDALSLWTLRQQVKADEKLVKNAKMRVNTSAPEHALEYLRRKKQLRLFAESQLGLPQARKAAMNARNRMNRFTEDNSTNGRARRPATAVLHRRKSAAAAVVSRPHTAPSRRYSHAGSPGSTMPVNEEISAAQVKNEEISAAQIEGNFSRDFYLQILSGELEEA
eukprot:TRINITY_DN2849_c0_g1_i5.p1 TRINITY_DN2849_c0_g1~~TRINITY_DN2849_c0_g1_i5.p1  ORF type:complete len:228 (-),score=20.64 TRINITY_DN2849_c0_g1_i5:142-825(-)